MDGDPDLIDGVSSSICICDECIAEDCGCVDNDPSECECDECACGEESAMGMTVPIIGAVIAGPAIAGTITKLNSRLTRKRVRKLVKTYGSGHSSRKVRLFSRRPKMK